MLQCFLGAFLDIPESQDADSRQRHVLPDTGQCLHLANSGTTRVHISDHQHSAAGTAANQETANMANDGPLDDSDSGNGHQRQIRAQHRHRQHPQRLIQQSRAQCRQSQGGSVDHSLLHQ